MVAAHFWVEGKADQKFLADVMEFWFGLAFRPKDFSHQNETKKINIKIQELGGKNAF